jgi:hypothetical protein
MSKTELAERLDQHCKMYGKAIKDGEPTTRLREEGAAIRRRLGIKEYSSVRYKPNEVPGPGANDW